MTPSGSISASNKPVRIMVRIAACGRAKHNSTAAKTHLALFNSHKHARSEENSKK